MEIISGSDPRISWHHDSDFGRVVQCQYPDKDAHSGAIGNWGELVARNYLARQGIFTVRHAVFRLPSLLVVSDLFHLPSATLYEVKTTVGSAPPNFLGKIWLDRELVHQRVAKQIVYLHVKSRDSTNVTFGQYKAIRSAGFKFIVIEV